MPGSWVFSCSNLTASSVAFCDFALLLILASRSIFSTTSSLFIFSCVVVNFFFSSKEKTVVILDGSFDSSSDALLGSAFRNIVFDTWLMTVLAWSKPICTSATIHWPNLPCSDKIGGLLKKCYTICHIKRNLNGDYNLQLWNYSFAFEYFLCLFKRSI